ncbi:hypothetical protein KJ640_07715 [bacterium]|nr:hypothetical protein [bacterium]
MKEIKISDLLSTQEAFSFILKGKSFSEYIKEGYNLLIKGLPGTGKTTLGLQILHNIFNKVQEIKIFTLLEPINQIEHLYEIFGWEDLPHPIFLTDATDLCDRLDELLDPQIPVKYLMIDGISLLKYEFANEEGSVQMRMKKILEGLKSRGLFTILISEEAGSTRDRFFEYIVDGVIHLSAENRERYLEINKLRWIDHYPGRHGFKLQDKDRFSENSGIVIFPSISCYFSENKPLAKVKISSGVPGFDKLIEGGFQTGEIVFLMGSPGSGKTTFGIQFLKEIQNDNDKDNCSLLVSLDYTYKEIKDSLEGFETGIGFSEFMEGENLIFAHFNSAELLLDELTNVIIHTLKNKKITRLLIDSISSLESRFSTYSEYVNYISSLIRILKNLNVTTILTWETPRYFYQFGQIEICNSANMDTIISLREYDINNSIHRGLVVLKSLGKSHITELQSMDITSDKGLYLERRGWSKVSLLGGETEQIHEAKLFFKYFYQNRPHHEEIEEEAFKAFKDRYPNELFNKVLKTHPSPDHWSFKGYYGPGHSNTKVLSIRKYIMDILRENGVLTDLPEDVHKKYKERFESFLWKDTFKKDDDNSQMIPHYTDLGVLCYQKGFLEGLVGKDVYTKTWQEIMELKKTFIEQKNRFGNNQIYHLFVFPDTVKDARQFMAFFLELFWAHGEELWPEGETLSSREDCWTLFKDKVKSDAFAETLEFMRELVGDGEAIPNPNVGGHYHQSILSRRWYGKIKLYRQDMENRRRVEKPDFDFAIVPLPEVKPEIGSTSCLDIYCLGVMKGALAPETGWMFIDELLDFDRDIQQCARRGFPIVKEGVYRSDHIKKALSLDYNIITSIVLPKETSDRKICFRRTCDIPYYYEVEQLFAPIIRGIFDQDKRLEDIQASLAEAIIEEKLAKE